MSFDADHKSVDVECVEERADQTMEQQKEEKALVRKIDLYLLPTIWIMYLLSYMDRTNIGNAKVAGMTDDLGMDSNQYSISLIVFFITYVLFEVPSNLILSRTKPSIFLADHHVPMGNRYHVYGAGQDLPPARCAPNSRGHT
ncbi:hypothetical protein LTR22_005610 [Elasticomyces elasticus]|nr:hypothetical protein LTR22_005610 [Elasticomyces elasticus]KAK4921788.1 hypothetical protein LTR49_010896 [Elasticomyces elasticus]